MINKIVITGGAGFIGSHIVDYFAAKYPNAEIFVFDKMTYAAHINNIITHINTGRINLIVGDICDLELCKSTLANTDLLIHAAAESHVANSFGNSLAFTTTNVLGTHTLMEAALKNNVQRIMHISTDEVYGEILEGRASEQTSLLPTNPYSASKAAADMILQGYKKSFGLPIMTVRSNNIFGIRQFPEKIIPRFLMCMIKGEKMPINGNGLHVRHYLSIHDLCRALLLLVQKGEWDQIYNIGTMEEYKNIEIAHMICNLFNADPKENISYMNDRPYNDARYAITYEPLIALGWTPEILLRNDIGKLAKWYYNNFDQFEQNDKKRIHSPQTVS